MAGESGRERGGWAYVSIVSSLPWLSVDPRVALAIQFVGFEAVALALALSYGLWDAFVLGTVAIAVTTGGSYLMVSLTDRIDDSAAGVRYRRYLFESSIDVLMGVLAFVALVTYVLVGGAGDGPGLFARVLGDTMPAPAVFFGLLVAWDLCYRIGTGWWASVIGLWRTVRGTGDERFVREDALTILFAGLQLLLVPFLLADPLLAVAVAGHVGAVVVVSGTSIALQSRG